MKIHRFIGEFKIEKSKIKISEKIIVNQIKNVLKLNIGEFVVLSDGKGKEYLGQIESLQNKEIFIKITKNSGGVTVSKKQTNLYLAILKKENFELALQKATEVGISKIIPVITERTIKTGINIERLQKIAREASEQSGRNILPDISPILKFEKALEDGKNSEEKIILNLAGDTYYPNKKSKSSSIFIGPEGGFTEKEIILAKSFGYKVFSLGKLTLRAETAAIVASYRIEENI